MAIVNLSQNDFTYRLRVINCCIGNLTVDLLNKIKIGASDIKCKLIQLEVLQEMFEQVRCYNVLIEDEVTEDDNCLTEAQMQSMMDYMQEKCKLCINLPNYSYS